MSASPKKLDPFTQRRIQKFVEDTRTRSGQLPTLRDFETGGFSDEVIREAIRSKLISESYVTLTNGTIVKGYKISDESK